MSETVRSRGGRVLTVVGDAALLTMDRLSEFTARVDSDPRIASASLYAVPGPAGSWLRTAAPAGPLVALATDVDDLVGPPESLEPDAVAAWARRASDRGLWHDWWLTGDVDVARATAVLEPQGVDVAETEDTSGSRFAALRDYRPTRGRLTVTVDVTWLGPHETGSQVLTTSAIDALAQSSSVTEIRLVGRPELPAYASHLVDHERVRVFAETTDAPMSDVVWYPNQIDGRSRITGARSLGERVVTTYLDLIAYNIQRYHGSFEAWQAYRALQRRIALSVDGITTISADVADQLLAEVPRLEPQRVFPLPLGLDHITSEQVPAVPGSDLAQLFGALNNRRFVVVLGNDFLHKNRDFAIKVWQRALQAGQQVDLVLAGLHVHGNSSKADEDDLAARHLDLRGRLHTVGHVSSTSRAWLLGTAAAVMYPSSAEGFGFIPYEAAALGTPTVFTDFGPLREIADLRGVPRGWSIDAYTDDLVELLADDAARDRRVTALRAVVARHTWADFAEQLAGFFREIMVMPITATSGSGSSAEDAAALSAILSSRTWRATAPLRRLARRRR